ncbi:hypothetical protein JTE90_026552 [Oedothorax gibbosus]|uniref:Uncharacterized protein n=1 Tax=Oedothorax gibbosus TaxID=931172 RepID=A0AAV6U3F2_9ARAC|nr:hypothetical protein JTE90_026552 [Oedothorax gibbosus]
MNSAAVIGRQLRQQHPPASQKPLAVPSSGSPKNRPRTPSHHPGQPSPPKAELLLTAAAASSTTNQQQQQQDQKQQKGGLAKMKSCMSCRCIWLCFKALSGGVLLIALGVGMTVFGFYADTFAVHETFDPATNSTSVVRNESLKMHLHNLTYVGPVFMGLGGMMIVAACVLIDAQKEELLGSSAKQVEEQQLIADKAESSRCNGPATFFTLDLPPARVQDKGGGTRIDEDDDADEEMKEIVTVAEVARLPNGHRPPSLPVTSSTSQEETPLTTSSLSTPPLPRVAVRQKNSRNNNPGRNHPRSFLSPLFDVPSPLDIQILDPDGCTPGDALEMDVFSRATKCFPPPPPQRLQLAPRYLASVESDGLSDDDESTSFSTGPSYRTGYGGGLLPGPRTGYCSPEGPDAPLLGRCSPPSSPEYPVEPLMKRGGPGLRRFQLMRPNSRTLFDGPASEGGSR